MPGPISIQNSQQAIDMLNQLQSGQSYMISSDGKSIQEATLGHKIRQFFGFSSAKAENKAALDLIKNTIRDDPRYADVADTMFNGVQEGKALTAEKIKTAFKSVQSNLIAQTVTATDKLVSTIFAQLSLSKKDDLDAIFNRMPSVDLNGDNSPASKVATYLKAAVRAKVKEAAEGPESKSLSTDDIRDIVKNEIRKLAETAKSKDTNDLGFQVIFDGDLNSFAESIRAKSPEVNGKSLTALNKTNIAITTVNAHDTEDASYVSMNRNLNNIQQNLSNLISKKTQESIGQLLDVLQQRMGDVAERKLESDTRDFKTRLSKDVQFQNTLTKFCDQLRKAVNSVARHVELPFKEAEDSESEIIVGELKDLTSGAMPKDIKSHLNATIAKLENVRSCGDMIADATKIGENNGAYNVSITIRHGDNSVTKTSVGEVTTSHIEMLKELQALLMTLGAIE